ncbi:MAG: lamin tail domain-containing protein [Acidobacteriota bacterium]
MSRYCPVPQPLVTLVLFALVPGARAQQPVLNEILYDPIGPGNHRIEILNPTAAPLDVGGYSLCVQVRYWSIPMGTTVPAGGTLVVRVDESGMDNPAEVFTGPWVTLRANDSVGLYVPGTRDFGDPANIVDYVGWGAGGQAREDVAVAAGIWPLDDFIPRVPEGSSLLYSGSGDEAAAWCEEPSPSIGAPNDPCPSPPVINEVLYDPIGDDEGNQRLELLNPGPVAIDVGGYVLCSRAVYWSIPDGVMLAAGETLVVRLDETGVDAPTEVFTGPFTTLRAAESVALYRPGTGSAFALPENIVDYVSWGSGRLPRESVAVAAGIWPFDDFVPGVPEGSSIKYSGSGDDAASWCEEPVPSIGLPNSPCVVEEDPPEVDDGGDPDGNGLSTPLTVQKMPGSPGCLVFFDEVTPASGYNVYRGTIASLVGAGLYDHVQVTSGCNLPASPYTDLDDLTQSAYYLVVARTVSGTEGSYGQDATGAERPATNDPSIGGTACP